MLRVLSFRPTARPTAALAVPAAGLAALVALAPGAAARPRAEGLGTIAFARADGIYAVRADGSGLRALRRGGVATQPRDLAWSRDGSRLLFVARDERIWSMDAEGKNLVRLAKGRSPTWSPDGRRVAFVKYGNRGFVWVVNADGSGEHRLVKAPVRFVWDVDWSPRAADRLAFATGSWFSDVYVLDIGSGGARTLTRGRATGVEPAWSPDGRRVAYAGDDRKAEIYVAGAGGGAPLRLTRDARPDASPTWSPDGTAIAFVRAGAGEVRCANCPPAVRGPAELYVVRADGTGLTRLTHDTVDERSPAWQPVVGA